MASRTVRSLNDDAFIDAILDAPDDDAPRLVYADALSERGDLRGEFISVQCARAKLERDGKLGTRAHFDLLERERALEPDRWLPPALKALRGTSCHWTYERGFLAELQTGGDGKRKAAWPHLARMPLERVLVDNSGKLKLDALVESTSHPTVKTVRAHSSTGIATFDAKLLAKARGANVWAGRLPDASTFPAIVSLQVHNPNRDAIAQLCAMPKLRELRIVGAQGLEPDHLAEILRAKTLVNLSVVLVGERHAVALLKAKPSPVLRALTVRGKPNKDEPFAGEALATSPSLPQLTELGGDFLLDESLVATLEKRTKLTSLRVEHHTAAGIDALLRSKLGKRLEELELHGHHTPRESEPLPSLAGLAKLRTLRLFYFDVDDAAAKRLVKELAHVPDLRDAINLEYGPNAEAILHAQWPSAELM